MVIVAHDNDAILGVGGRIRKHIRNNDDVCVVIVTDGRNSHKAVLGVEINPTPEQVREARHWEIIRALTNLGVKSDKINFLDEIDAEGARWQNDSNLRKDVFLLIANEYPDIIYFHGLDTHVDHRAVNLIVTKALEGLCFKPQAYTFTIWAKKVARDGPEHDLRFAIEAIPEGAIIDKIDSDIISRKRESMSMMNSLVSIQPYDWPSQEKPILDSNFIEYLLGKEIFIKIQ